MPEFWTLRRSVMLGGLVIIGLLQAVSALLAATAGTQILSGNSASHLVWMLSGGSALLFTLYVTQRRMSEGFALSYVNELRIAYLSHVLRQPADEKSPRFGLIMTRVVNDFSAIKLWLSDGLATALIAFSVVTTVLVYLHMEMSAMFPMVLTAICFWMGVALAAFFPLHSAIIEARRRRGRIASKSGAFINAQPTLLAHGRLGASLRSVERQAAHLRKSLLTRATSSGFVLASGELVLPMTIFLIGYSVWFGNDIDYSKINVGMLLICIGLLAAQLNSLGRALDYFISSRIARKRIREIMARPALELVEGSNAMSRTKKGRSLEVRDLFLDSLNENWSFKVEASKIALLPKMQSEAAEELFLQLSGHTKATSGKIFVGNQEISNVRRRDWFRSVSLLAPSMPLSIGSVRKNATFGMASSISDEEVERLFDIFGLDEEQLEEGLRENSKPSERLSLKIRLVRTFLRKSSVILIHDPTLLREGDLLELFLKEVSDQQKTAVFALENEEQAFQLMGLNFSILNVQLRRSRIAQRAA